MNVEVACSTRDVLHDAIGEVPPRTWPTRAHHDLGSAFGTGESHERAGDVVVNDLLEPTVEFTDEGAHVRHVRLPTRITSVHDMHGDEFGTAARRNARRTA